MIQFVFPITLFEDFFGNYLILQTAPFGRDYFVALLFICTYELYRDTLMIRHYEILI